MKRFLVFLSLFVFYIVTIAGFSDFLLEGDEIRHMKYALNLLDGSYTDRTNPELVNGPVYPLVLAGLAGVGATTKIMCIINSIFLIGAVLFFYRTLAFYFDEKHALLLSLVFGLYPPLIRWSPYVYSEALAVFLACGFLYFFIKSQIREEYRRKHIIGSAVFLSLLALTKIIFGYVIIASLFIYLFIYIFNKSRKIKSALIIVGVAFVFCLPYLTYTYSLTQKFPYWGSGGGELLYWRSSPFPNEYGDWISSDIVTDKKYDDYFDTTVMIKNHKVFLDSLKGYSHVERNEALKNKAIENMRQYPWKYVQNTVASGFRLFFNYPYSYTQQKMTSYFYFVPNGVLLLLLIVSLLLIFLRMKEIPTEFLMLGIFLFLILGGLIAGNGKVRYLLPTIPLLLLLICFILGRFLQIRFVKPRENQL